MKINKTDNIIKSPCIVELSDINFGHPTALFCSYKHSPCAEIFHRNLKEKAGIEVVASFAYGDIKLYPAIELFLWVQDSDATEQILKNTPYQHFTRTNPLVKAIIECLIDALEEDKNQTLSSICDLWRMQQENDSIGEDKIYVSVTLLSYWRSYTDELFGATKMEITSAFAKHFPSYEKLTCNAFSLASGPHAHNHLYLFFTPEDQKRAEASGYIEKMKRLAYDIIKTKDIHEYVSYESYAPHFTNRRQLTREQLFFIAKE